MPAGDITHPVPDLTGYIAEGQVVLSVEAAAHGGYPPVDPLSSPSRLMRMGAGPGRTRADHLDLAAQVLAALARARQVEELAELIGGAALTETDRAYLDFTDRLRKQLLDQWGEPGHVRGLPTAPGGRIVSVTGKEFRAWTSGSGASASTGR
jgi:V/A-type H+-transporting ATPase subunit B